MNRGVLTLNSHATSACRALAAKLPPGVEFREGSRGDLQSDLGKVDTPKAENWGAEAERSLPSRASPFWPPGDYPGTAGHLYCARVTAWFGIA